MRKPRPENHRLAVRGWFVLAAVACTASELRAQQIERLCDPGGSYSDGLDAGGCGCPTLVEPCCGQTDWLEFDGVVRGFFLNDQRVQWSGLENTFAAEAALQPVVRRRFGEWETRIEGEFYLNQRFDKNILVDTAERRSYTGNFDFDVFEISRLFVSAGRGDWYFALGKFDTPFGRYYFPLYSNQMFDAPFIRSEAIAWRETGLLARYQPEWMTLDVALVNGSEDGDTNSSKALISRIGVDRENWALGTSIKVQDGVGSEHQKYFNNHIGGDAMIRCGRWTLSGEAIYDEYGFRRPFDPNEITWGRSIYFRDLNRGWHEPITGVGYYANLGYAGERWIWSLDYGQFHPKQIGHTAHDVVKQRGIVKLAYSLTDCCQLFSVTMIENGGYIAQDNRPRRGTTVFAGVQATF